ncbi:MAG: leucine-rich repeat protein, partial [Thermoguttaceae bacterium]|nr:leucine-rich repeat protein [Thermoguttaceae bacterium]
TIGVSAFCYCRSLKSFTGATSVWKIENSAFSGCSLLTEVELPSGLLEIGASAFAECGFASIKIPASVRVMGDAALAVTPLKTIEVEEGNEALKVVDGALLSKDGKSFFRLPPALKLKDFKIPEGVEIIERAALGGNETLESVEIPASVTTIEHNAFYRNSSLTEIVIPKGVNTIADAFPLCDALERFEVDPENAVYKSENGALLSKDGKTFYRIVAVERDPNGAPITLEGNENLSEATKRDETSRSIPAYKNDVYVVPDGVATLADGAFRDVRRTRNAFTEIVLPQSLERIEARAFQYCSRLETLRIPANVAGVGDYVFLGCDALKTFEVAPENRVLSAKDGLMLSDGGKMFCCVVADQNRRVLKLPEGVERAQSNELASKKFTELVLPESLIEIKTRAFANSENLTKVTIPKNVRLVGALAFRNSPKLAEIVLKSSATKYEANAFQDVAPNCEIRVDETQPSNLKDDTNGEGSESTEERTMTLEEAEKIFQLAFEGDEATIVGVINKDAHSVVAPRKIGEYAVTRVADNAFANMHYLVEARLPSTIREIGAYAFVNCRYLEQVVIPSATESVGVGAFLNCRGLRAIG